MPYGACCITNISSEHQAERQICNYYLGAIKFDQYECRIEYIVRK